MALQVGEAWLRGSVALGGSPVTWAQAPLVEGTLPPGPSRVEGTAGFEAFSAEGLAPGWSLLVQGHSDSPEDKFEINFLSEAGDIAFHFKPRFTSQTLVGNAFQGGCWGPEEVSSVFPLALGEPFEIEVSSDAQHFHVHTQELLVLQFAHRHRPLAAITRVQVLSDQRLAQVELARRGLSWGSEGQASKAKAAVFLPAIV
ncbi:PREDICTED: grifin [Miniopterus natalensis]|uniref:grifin n=1 Tax=Miniopterus natalensis TaxID=291302 RepID=UPI0007A6C75C|nr:PREDICTED: grifin [Miniopterus natalensis]